MCGGEGRHPSLGENLFDSGEAPGHDPVMEHLSAAALEAGLDEVRRAPPDRGRVELIVARPARGEREELEEGTLDENEGLVGDNWRVRGSALTQDGLADPDKQLTVMNVRAAALVAGRSDRRQLAGDQIYVDLDLSVDNLPPGALLELGSAVIQISQQPHLGCKKFAERFGQDALRLVNSYTGRQLRLRGLNAKVVVAGTVRQGDVVRKLSGS
jgi:MOSC domain-containing protein